MANKLHILQTSHMFMSAPERFSMASDTFGSDDMLFMAQKISQIIKQLLYDSRHMHDTLGEVSEIIERITSQGNLYN